MYGDLMLTPDQEKMLLEGSEGRAQGILYSARRWPGGVMPYHIDARMSKYEQKGLEAK